MNFFRSHSRTHCVQSTTLMERKKENHSAHRSHDEHGDNCDSTLPYDVWKNARWAHPAKTMVVLLRTWVHASRFTGSYCKNSVLFCERTKSVAASFRHLELVTRRGLCLFPAPQGLWPAPISALLCLIVNIMHVWASFSHPMCLGTHELNTPNC